MSNHATLEAATQDRKARLAQLKSLKRKQAPSDDADGLTSTETDQDAVLPQQSQSPTPEVTKTYLSGRNYDPETRGPKLGFESAPAEGQITLESQARAIAEDTKRQAEEEAKAEKPLDLFKLQPKKPNWDLKRDLERKLEILNVRTDNAIARLVREKITKAQAEAKAKGQVTDGEAVGMDGTTLVEALHQREREEEEDERKEREDEELH